MRKEQDFKYLLLISIIIIIIYYIKNYLYLRRRRKKTLIQRVNIYFDLKVCETKLIERSAHSMK